MLSVILNYGLDVNSNELQVIVAIILDVESVS